ncbi:hypothetical protein [Streptomyces sp. NPDC047841]|uniref:hypothetical protein n=1 Tax=Streptomyces sp. NPDC047841 TaxID=3154708 RepID=UPI0034523AC3
MLGLELVVLLGLATLLGTVLSTYFRITPPVVLLVADVLLGFIFQRVAVGLALGGGGPAGAGPTPWNSYRNAQESISQWRAPV